MPNRICSLETQNGYTIMGTIIGTHEISVYNVEYLLKKQNSEYYETALVIWKHMLDKE